MAHPCLDHNLCDLSLGAVGPFSASRLHCEDRGDFVEGAFDTRRHS